MVQKILVIEDNATIRNLFLECLKAKGFYAIGAKNGLIGVNLAQEQLPDLITCDIIMPELDGYGVLAVLRQHLVRANIPFIFVTARTTRTDIRKGMELGADDYITKPCSVDELLRAIATQLEKQTILRQLIASKPLPPLATDTGVASRSIFPSVSRLREVFDFIEANYHRPITLPDVAQAVGYSPAYLTNMVRQQTGKTLYGWIIERRMAQAYFFLLETSLSVNRIAEAVGYRNPGHFITQFRKLHGTTPQAWRSARRC